MEDRSPKGSMGATGLRWKGLLAEGSLLLKHLAAAFVAIVCVVPILTQWGYVGVQFADGTASYLMFLLVPVALGATLLGTLAGAAAGLFVGSALCLHASLAPLDYYEYAYVTPVTSILAAAASGLVLGLLLSRALRRRERGWRRVPRVWLACLGASCAFSALWALGAPEAARAEFSATTVAFQAVCDSFILLVSSYLGIAFAEHGASEDGGLRSLFGAWLAALVLAAFLVIGTASFVSVTEAELDGAAVKMRDEVVFVLDQVGEALRQDEAARAEGREGNLLAGLFAGYSEDADGLLVAVRDGRVIGTDSDRVALGERIEEVFDADVLAAVDASVARGTLERIVYAAPSDFSDLYDLELPGTREAFSALLVRQVGHLAATEGDGLRVVLIRPTYMVFAARDSVVGWVFVASLALLATTYTLSRLLLDRLVARRIDATNGVLARITTGDLEARVEAGGTFEFAELSAGINQTVDALKGWIAQAESRMDAELATAKAIQESALPSVFPPFPDIRRFDIFANMNAAKEVGGDFYDFFLVGDDCGPDAGKLAFVIADVSGKGVPAALFMMKAKTQIRDYLESGMEVGEAVENANRRLCEGNEEGMFVTAWVGVLDYASGHVDFVNAGHNPPLVLQEGSWRWVKELSGMPLGLFDEVPYATYSLECEAGDQILLYTDGVTEAFSTEDEKYGEKRLEALVGDCFAAHPRELVNRVRASVAAHAEGAEQSDDITILALEVGVPPEEKVQLVLPAKLDEIERVFAFLHAELDRRLCPVRVQNQLDVAVEELFVNVCSYAYEGVAPGVERCVRVTHAFSAEPRCVTVEIMDDGVPFDPLTKAEQEYIGEDALLDDIGIGGLGILMASRNVDGIRYERVGDSNVVTLVKCW